MSERSELSQALRALVALGVVVLVLVIGAGPASAHAVLEASDPADGEQLDAAPEAVDLEFSEDVEIGPGAVEVFNRDGDRVDDGEPEETQGSFRIGLESGLGNGTYIVTYRVISADGHAVSGAVLFSVGEPVDAVGIDITALLGGSNDAADVAAALTRAAAYAGAILAAGVTLYALTVGPASAARSRVVRPAAVLGAVASVVSVGLQAIVGSGRGWGAAVDLDRLEPVVTDEFGFAALVTAAGLTMLAIGLRGPLALAAAVASLGGFAITGHTRVSSPVGLIVAVNVVHLLTVGLWVGGLVIIARLLWRARRDGELPGTVAAAVGRFSVVAFVTFLAAAAAGGVMAWSEVRALRALDTTYGTLLLVKISLVAVVAAVAWYNRARLLPVLTEARSWRRLAGTVLVELTIVVGIVAVTSLLVNVTPAKTAAGVEGPFDETEQISDELRLQLIVTPNGAGEVNDLHLYLTDAAGRPVDAAGPITVQLSMPGLGIEALDRTPFRPATGHATMRGRELSVPGAWQITVTVPIDSFTEATADFTVVVND